MSIITTTEAKRHLRVDSDDEDKQIALYVAAAEQSAAEYLERMIFADEDELAAARLAAPAALTAATAAYEAAVAAADALASTDEKALALRAASNDYLTAKETYRRAMQGVVMTEAIRSAVLLHLGSLYANRENEISKGVEFPTGMRWMLNQYRVYA